MKIHPRGIAVLTGVSVLLALAISSNGCNWFHAAEALASLVIALGLTGVLSSIHETRPSA